jgi:hypothetical protein|tara:strand:+ start:510 stop:1553 length:1044 start_codon:yes stop_codon:yes gene_type:complete
MSDEQRPDVLRLGEHDYPALKIREEADPQHPDTFDENNAIDFEYFVYLTAFQETFNARWQEGERSYGRLNPMYYYGGTEREANISFTLPAMTVQESEQNLRKCSELSRAVYGQYRSWSIDIDNTVKDFTMIGHRYFRVDFGSLIRDERVFISGFTFTVNPDAGVFDYSPASGAEALRRVTSGRRNEAVNDMQGQVLPRQIDIQISMIFRHDYPLGFGGPNRLGHPDKWAENRSRDFPHGTGEIPVQSYMSYTGGTTTATRTAAQAHAIYLSNTASGRAEVSVAAAEAGIVNPNYELNLDADGSLISSEETYVPIPGRTPIGGDEPPEYRYNSATGEYEEAVPETDPE